MPITGGVWGHGHLIKGHGQVENLKWKVKDKVKVENALQKICVTTWNVPDCGFKINVLQ